MPSPSSARSAILVALLAIAVYAPSVAVGGFLQYDDDHYVTASPAVANFEVGRAFDPKASREDLGAEYLPVRDLTYMVDAKLWGVGSPRAFRATNLAWYALACALAYLVLVEVTGNPALAFLAAAFFAVHPVHAESVAWIASRKDVVSGALGLGALLLHARKRLVLAVLLGGAAMLAKSTLICIPLLVPLVEKRLTWRVVPHALLAGLIAWNAVQVGERTGIAHPLPQGGYWTIFFTDAPIVVRYLSESFVPVGMRVVYAPPFHDTADKVVLASLGVLLALGVGALLRRELRTGIALFGLALAPVLNVQPGAQWIADRYLFLPLLGLCLVIARVLVRIGGRAPRLSMALASLGLAVFATLGVARGLDFTTDERLFKANLLLEPDDPIVHHQLARGLLARARRAEDAGQDDLAVPIARAAEAEDREALRRAVEKRLLGPFWFVEVWDSVASERRLQRDLVGFVATKRRNLIIRNELGDASARKAAENVGSWALARARDESNPEHVALMLEAARCFAFAHQYGLARSAALRVNRTAPELVERAVLEDAELERALRQ